MSFSVQDPASGLEWSGCNLNTVFAQRRNLVSPRFLGMLADILRFNRWPRDRRVRGAEAELPSRSATSWTATASARAFRDWYFLPMIGCIWSAPPTRCCAFPVATMIRFCHNHGLIQVTDRPQWHTVRGGSRHYVDKHAGPHPRLPRWHAGARGARLPPGQGSAGVLVTPTTAANASTTWCWPATATRAWRCWPTPAPTNARCWAPSATTATARVLHTDASVLPRRRWPGRPGTTNARRPQREQAAVCLHYLINRLQPLPWQQPVVVSLNPVRRADRPGQVIGEYDYATRCSTRRHRRAGRLPQHPGPVAPVVRRRLDTLRLPRGRPDVGLAVADALRARWAALPAGRRRMNDGPQHRHRRGAPPPAAAGGQRLRLPHLLPAAADAQPAPRARRALARNRFGCWQLPRPRPWRRPRRRAGLARRTAGSAKAWPTPTARSGCTPTRACWAMSSSRSASGTATGPTARWRPSWPRSTTPSASATATCWTGPAWPGAAS
jgi:hypothetical protein